MSQIVSRYDSLALAKTMMDSQRLPEAINILEKLDKNYPSDENVLILYSQALYWSKDLSRTIAYIKINTIKKPYPEVLNFHFGKILFELYHLKDAERYLSLYLVDNPDHAETLIMLAQIAYWQGKSSKEIMNKIQRVLETNPLYNQAIELKEEILLNFAPEFSIGGSYFEDSQPLQVNSLNTKLRFYQNAWIQPSVQFDTHKFKDGEMVMVPTVSNKTFLTKSKTELEFMAGVFKNSWSEDIIPTWTIGLKQKTYRNITFEAEAKKTPYLYTLASIAENVVPTILTTSIGKESGKGPIGKILAQQWQFSDQNKVNILSAWVLLPVIHQKFISIDIGYAFTAADSDQNRFELDNTIDTSSSNTFGQVLPGVFSPYFTPQNQKVHAALGKLDIKFSRKVSLSLNSNIGVYAIIDNPNYVYYGPSAAPLPNKNSRNPNSNNPLEDKISMDDIYKIFVTTRYLPLDMKAKFLVDVNRKLSINTEYAYVETIFFRSQAVNMGLKWKFVSR